VFVIYRVQKHIDWLRCKHHCVIMVSLNVKNATVDNVRKYIMMCLIRSGKQSVRLARRVSLQARCDGWQVWSMSTEPFRTGPRRLQVRISTLHYYCAPTTERVRAMLWFVRPSRSVPCPYGKHSTFQACGYYRTLGLLGNRMLEVEPTDQRGTMTTGNGRNGLDLEKITSTSSVSRSW